MENKEKETKPLPKLSFLDVQSHQYADILSNSYYHITNIDNIKKILKHGLKANEEGDIFLFEHLTFTFGHQKIRNTVADHIAVNQIFLPEYALFRVNRLGINVELINDNVAEFCSDVQWIAKQPVIQPEFIKYIGSYTANYNSYISTEGIY